MKKLLLLSLTIFSLPAFVLPPKAAKGKILPTFDQMISHEEARQQRMQPASLAGLPTALRELMVLHMDTDVLNIPALAKDLTTLAATSRALNAAINNPQNMLALLKLLPKAGAVVLANGLRNLPGIKSKEVQDWLKSIGLTGGPELFLAIKNGNNQEAIRLLKNLNIAVNWKDEFGVTPLKLASFKGQAELVKLLINAGASVNADALNNTPLMATSASGMIQIVKLLLVAGADVNVKDNHGNTALIYASAQGQTDIVRILLAKGADIFVRNNDKKTALDVARKNLPIVQDYPEGGNLQVTIKILEDAEKAQKEKAARK